MLVWIDSFDIYRWHRFRLLRGNSLHFLFISRKNQSDWNYFKNVESLWCLSVRDSWFDFVEVQRCRDETHFIQIEVLHFGQCKWKKLFRQFAILPKFYDEFFSGYRLWPIFDIVYLLAMLEKSGSSIQIQESMWCYERWSSASIEANSKAISNQWNNFARQHRKRQNVNFIQRLDNRYSYS